MRGVYNFQLKKQAIILRQKGYTYPMIEKKLSIPRATLNGWFAGLKISNKAKIKLVAHKKNSLKIARELALKSLKIKREQKLQQIKEEIYNDFIKFDFNKKSLELLLAMLYLGEGFKKTRSHIGLGNSNPEIALMFVKLLRSIYKVEDSKFRCFLHLRMDQDEKRERVFWSNFLGISIKYFRKTQFDKRTENTKTRKEYHGVCAIYCYDAKIEKRLVILQKYLISKILGV